MHATGADAETLAALCAACGLCCDGALFGRVPLDADEVARVRRLGLPVVASGRAFDQPCPAHAAGCTVYAERPRACRAFVCATYDALARGAIDVGAAHGEVTAARAELDAVERDAAAARTDGEATARREALGERLARAFRRT